MYIVERLVSACLFNRPREAITIIGSLSLLSVYFYKNLLFWNYSSNWNKLFCPHDAQGIHILKMCPLSWSGMPTKVATNFKIKKGVKTNKDREMFRMRIIALIPLKDNFYFFFWRIIKTLINRDERNCK